MGLAKSEMEKMEDLKRPQGEGKECNRCFTTISAEEFEENNGLCNYCMAKWEKTQKE